jgi:hypothetical protein
MGGKLAEAAAPGQRRELARGAHGRAAMTASDHPPLTDSPPPASNLAPADADGFYADSLRLLHASGIPFLVAGTFAVNCYTGINRATKDLDLFCKAGDLPRLLLHCKEHGFETEIEDERWIAKVRRGQCFFDVIFGSATAVVSISDHWFVESHPAEIYDVPVQLTPPTEMIWSKPLLQNRHRCDGVDIAHLILRPTDRIDRRRLLLHMEQYWEVLLMHLLNFRFIYPFERERVPRWLVEELLERGRLFSAEDYRIDVQAWGFADVVGPAADETHG